MSQSFEEAAKKLDIRAMVVASVITALALVVSLSWNDAIKETIAQLTPRSDSLYYKYLDALVVTIMAITISYLLYRGQQLKIRDLEKLAKRESLKTLSGYQSVLKKIDVMRIAQKEKDKLKRAIIKEGV